ncbi:MAG: GH116 family glycosyl-hydrolase [Candidatus Aminicenantales bacterium]
MAEHRRLKNFIPVFCGLILLAGFLHPETAGREKIRTFSGDGLRTIAFPIGGIATGNITLGGRGNIQELEIFNRPAKNVLPELTFFAIRARAQGEKADCRVLERQNLPPYTGAGGYSRRQLSGLPRFQEVLFRGEYPFAYLTFLDDRFPALVSLEAFNPLVPLDPEKSGLPVAIFNWKIRNPGNKTINVDLAFSMLNPLQTKDEKGNLVFRKNINRCGSDEKASWIELTTANAGPTDPEWGSIVFGTSSRTVDLQTRWYRGGWWDNAHIFWDDFSADGRLVEVRDALESEGESSDVASLVIHAKVLPGGEALIPVYLAWNIPNRRNDWNDEAEVKGRKFRNSYANRFADAVQVLRHVLDNLQDLTQETQKYHDLLFSSSYPSFVLDAVSSQVSSLKTNLVIQDETGCFYGWEGLSDGNSCCFGSCTHVWNYEQTMAFLFPSLERNMRETAFLNETQANGYQEFRTLFPIGNYWWKFKPAADGQMGNIVRTFRDWKISGDTAWLKKLWPGVKAALEFAWKGVGEVGPDFEWQKKLAPLPWDTNRDGVMEGEQHNTYDIEFYGPNTMTGSLYLAALKAGAEMAGVMGEKEKAAEYLRLYESGRQKADMMLWNGDYYVQKVQVLKGLEVPAELVSPGQTAASAAPAGEFQDVIPKYQYGDGCLSDQLLGQYLAFVAGLDYILPEAHVKKALESIYRNNFVGDLSAFANIQRVYALNNEAGLVICSWPNGNRPALPFPYSDEVWTGIEYQVAASLIYSGQIEKGLAVVEAIRNRHAGFNRNPWDEFECGHHYARAMASWALLLALSGFRCDATQNFIGFSPQLNRDDFNTFWSSGGAWGGFLMRPGRIELEVAHGELSLQKLGLPADLADLKAYRASLNGKALKFTPASSDGYAVLSFPEKITLAKGNILVLEKRPR